MLRHINTLSSKVFGAGLAAGSAGSLVGMGGGFVAIPAMTSRFIGLSQHEAHATSLVSVLFTGTAGGASFALAGSVDWAVAATVAGGGIVTAQLGARFARQLPGNRPMIRLLRSNAARSVQAIFSRGCWERSCAA